MSDPRSSPPPGVAPAWHPAQWALTNSRTSIGGSAAGDGETKKAASTATVTNERHNRIGELEAWREAGRGVAVGRG
ncbi:hypothetical protein [Fimbriiglobus ruber]|uniref:hypothetical protein n=1 Tax=Fimbriiglobus ruber TaxID=1908690 RepID=UPI00137A254A|nr:hypothetical protein [Fimbriiglobus ruber]